MDARPGRRRQTLAAGVGIALLGAGFALGRYLRVGETDIDRLVMQATVTRPASGDQAADAIIRTSKSIDLTLTTVQENLANAETTGYKARTIEYAGDGRAEVRINVECGAMQSTGRQMDFAVQGTGFVPVKLNGHVLFTRNGNLFRNSAGDLIVNIGDGAQLVPPINIPPDVPEENIAIDTYGKVSYIRPGRSGKTLVGQIQLAQIVSPRFLTPIQGTTFVTNERTGEALVGNPGDNGTGTVLSSFLEESNVNLHAEELREIAARRWQAAIDRSIARADRR